MKPTWDEISHAAYKGDEDALRSCAERGADFNELKNDETLLQDVVSNLCVDRKPHRYDIVRLLLSLGADPNVLGEEDSSPLTHAMLSMDTEMLRVLLEAGADPNRVQGMSERQLLYDWAVLDYVYEIFDVNKHDGPTEEDTKDEDSWLRFLDKQAVKYGVRRPDHLFLLRQFGAKSMQETENHCSRPDF